ncbi:MAG: hypothetical protein H6720_05050 [Sandaracinus sp.]|nr:hypothetical protein [Sandaracinus sp.]
MKRLLLPLVLVAACAAPGRAPSQEGVQESASERSTSGGADLGRSESPGMPAPAPASQESYEVDSADSEPAPRAPQAVPQSVTVETVTVGGSTAGTTGGNPNAGRAWARLVDVEDALHDALGLASVDCGDARDLRDRICELGERICDLADESGDSVTDDRCEDGRARCERARRRVADRCD